MACEPAGQGGRGFAQAMEDVGLEFVESIEEKPAIVAFQKGDIEGRMTDNFDSGRDDWVDIAAGGADEDDMDGFVGEAHEEKFEVEGVFGDGPA